MLRGSCFISAMQTLFSFLWSFSSQYQTISVQRIETVMLFFAFLLVIPSLVNSDAAPCCFANKFRAKVQQFGGHLDDQMVPHKDESTSSMQYDFDLKMIRVDTVTKDLNILSMLSDYNKNMTYFWYESNRTCTSVPITEELAPPCIPQGATLMSSSEVAGNLKTNTWKVTDGNTTRLRIVTVTDRDCTPISESRLGYGNSVMTSVFSDFTVGALIAGVFDLPVECMH